MTRPTWTEKAVKLLTEQFHNFPVIRVPQPREWWNGLSRTDKLRWSRYIILISTTNVVIWGGGILFLLTTRPVYTSSWGLILPGSVNAVNVNLPDIGQASASSGSAGMATSTFDPRDNYEYIFTSEQVISQAANNARVSKEAFGKPRIKNLDNTTIMQIEVTGPSPIEARRRSYAFYDALRQRLNELRTSEIEQRQIPTQAILRDTQSKLAAAQRKVSAYKLSSGINSIEQVETLSTNIEQLRRQRAELAGQQAQAETRAKQLAADLGLSASEAADAFKLQADQIFQQHLKDYSEATAILKVQLSKFGRNHPRITKEVKRKQAAEQALTRKARELLSRPLRGNTLAKLALSTNGSGRDTLFQALVNDQSNASGAASQVRKLDQQIYGLEQRLQSLSQRQSKLENLKRDEQIAEAVFASTLAKLDLGQADLFAAFPLVQLAVEPNLPDKPSSPKKGLVIAGSLLGSFLTTVGMWILWIRKPWIRRLANLISR